MTKGPPKIQGQTSPDWRASTAGACAFCPDHGHSVKVFHSCSGEKKVLFKTLSLIKIQISPSPIFQVNRLILNDSNKNTKTAMENT